MKPRHKAYLFLLITALIWGWASPVVKYSTDYIPPIIMLLYRFTLSSLIAALFFPTYRKFLPKTITEWITITIYGFLVTTVTIGLYFLGVSQSSAIVSAMGSIMQPVMATLAGAYFLHETVSKREKSGLLIALIGSLIISFEPLYHHNSYMGTLLGNMLLIASRFSDVASAIIAKTILRVKVSPLALTHVSFMVGLITIIPIALFFYTPSQIATTISHAPIGAHLGVIYMALLSGTLAYTLFHAAEKTIQVGEAAVSYYLHPVFAAPLAILWLGESLTPYIILGCLIIAAGVILAEIKPSDYNMAQHGRKHRTRSSKRVK